MLRALQLHLLPEGDHPQRLRLRAKSALLPVLLHLLAELQLSCHILLPTREAQILNGTPGFALVY